MKYVAAALIFLMPALALADAPAALGPNNGAFGKWTAATLGSGTAKVCYAFTKALISKPNWKSRGTVMLTVTERAGIRDEVTLASGYTYPANAKVSLTIGTTNIDFYTSGATAFTTAGADAVSAFKAADTAVAKSTGPHGHPVQDTFTLAGFSVAYSAIASACP